MKLQINPLRDSLQFKLQQAIAKTVNRLLGLSLKPEEVGLEHPENPEHGDYATNIAMVIFSRLKTKNKKQKTQTQKLEKFNSPLDLAEAIKDKLLTNCSIAQLLNYCSVAAPGFINISVKPDWFVKELGRVLKEDKDYGRSKVGRNKKVMVEYAHPNTHKQFHIGHLRNINLGESVARILQAIGFQVIRTNYQGDVGLHIAKCLWGILQAQSAKRKVKNYSAKLKTLDEKIKFLGNCYAKGNKAYEEDKKAKEEILDINEQVYQKDPQILPLWQETRKWSLDYFERIYQRVRSRFDRLYFESEMLEGTEIAKKALQKGILKKSQGAIVFDGRPYGLDTRVFITKLGLPTYEAKELKLAQLEFSQFGRLEKNIHVVGPEQSSFFKVTFKVEELLDPERYRNKQFHLAYGWVRLKKGKMSSRLGTVVTGEWLLDEAKRRIKKTFPETSEEVAEKIAVGAVKYSFLKVNPQQEIAFDFEESISLEGNSGPYLQYTYARCQSVLRKASQGNTSEVVRLWRNSSDGGGIGEPNPEELAILRWLYRFPEVVLEAAENYSPNLICNFLYDLAQRYNSFYNKHRILNLKSTTEDSKLANLKSNFRLLLTAATAQVLKDGLHLLGIKVTEKM